MTTTGGAHHSDGKPAVIIVGSAGSDGDAVRDVLADLARTELIRPCYWLTPQDERSGPLHASRLDTEGVTTVSMLDDLGGQAWTSCCIALLQTVAPEVDHDRDLPPFAAAIADFLKGSIFAAATVVTRLNLIVPTSNAEGPVPELLLTGWEQTLVVSPEERAGPEHSNVLVRHDGNLAGHAAVAVASAAGLWVGMDPVPFPELEPESSSGEPRPRLMRTYVRAVRGGELTNKVAAATLVPPDGQWRVPEASGRALLPARDPGRLVEAVVEKLPLLDDGAFVYRLPPAPLGPKRVRVGWAGLGTAFAEVWRPVTRRLRQSPEEVKARFEQHVHKAFFGDDGAHRFELTFDEIDDQHDVVTQLRVQLAQRRPSTPVEQGLVAERALGRLGRGVHEVSGLPRAWAELRQLCLSLVDGGRLPRGFDDQSDGPRELILDTAHIAPDSETPRWVVPEELASFVSVESEEPLTLLPCDPVLAGRVEKEVAQAADNMAARAAEHAELARQTHAALARLEEQAAEVPGATPVSEEASEPVPGAGTAASSAGDETADDTPNGTTVTDEEAADDHGADDGDAADGEAAGRSADALQLKRQIRHARADAEAARRHAQQSAESASRAAAALDELRRWAEPRRRTLLWRIGDRVGAELERAAAAHKEATDAMAAAPAHDLAGVERARKRALVGSALSVLPAAVVLIWSVIAAVGLVGPPPLGKAVASALAIVVSFVAASLSLASYTRARSRVQWDYAKRRAEQLNQLDRLVHAARETARLSMLYRLYLDWAEILGCQIHRPWIPDEDLNSRPPVADVGHEALPPSLAVGESEISEHDLAALASSAARNLQREGWQREAYERAREHAADRQSHQEGRPAQDFDADVDSPTVPNGARGFLLAELRAHRPQQAAYRKAMGDIADHCASREPGQLFEKVVLPDQPPEEVTSFLSALIRTSDQPAQPFLVDVLAPEAALRRAAEDIQSYVWASRGIGAGGDVRERSVPTTRSGQYLLQAIRVDVSRELQASDLRVFAAPLAPPAAPADRIDIEEDDAW